VPLPTQRSGPAGGTPDTSKYSHAQLSAAEQKCRTQVEQAIARLRPGVASGAGTTTSGSGG
jgi:hypothetical protein